MKIAFLTPMSQFVLIFVVLCIGVGAGQDIPELKLDSRLERSLSGGQTHEYRIQLAAGQFLHVVVEQKGIDVEVVFVGPDGKQIGHIDSPNSAWGPEPMVAIADTSGEYRLRVVAGNPQAEPGKYEIRVVTLRPPTDRDLQHVKVNRSVEQAQDLLAQGNKDSLQAAAEKFKNAIVFYHSAGFRYDEALSLYTLGLIQAQSGDFRSALPSDEQALALFRTLKDVAMQGSTIVNMGGAYDILGDLPKALAAYEEAIALLKSNGDRLFEASALNNIGKIHADMAEWQEASEYYQQALAIFHEVGDREREAATLSNLGNVELNLAESDKALEYSQRALQLQRAAGDKPDEVNTLVQMGTARQNQGQLADALKLYEQAIELARSIGDHWREGKALLLLGSALVTNGEPQKALEQLQQSLKLLQAADDKRNEGVALRTLGQAYAALHQPEQALAEYQQALPILQAVGDRNYTAQTLMGIAQVERDQGHFTEARKHAGEALALVEQVRAKAGAQEDRASYFATQQSMGEFYIELLMRMHKQDPAAGYDAEAFQAAERERARSLLEMLAEAQVDIRQGVDPKLLQREHEIAGLLNSNAQRLLTLRGADTDEKAAALKKEISELESESQQLELAIRKSSPQYSAMTQPQPLTLKEIQQQVLDANTVLLEYTLGEERGYVWAVTTAGLKSYELPRRSEIEKSVREVVELLSARGTYIRGELPQQKKARIARADAQLPQAAARLSQMVLAPASAELGSKRLVLVTDGSLQYVPFAMLPVPKSNGSNAMSAAAPLVAEHEIVSLPSASTVAELRKQIAGRQPAPKTIAVLADPVFQSDDPRVSKQSPISKTAIENNKAAKNDIATAGPIASARKVSSQGNEAQEENSRILVHLAATEADNSPGEHLRVPRLPFTRQEADRIIKLAGEKDRFEALDFNASLATATSAQLGQYRYLHFATHGYLDSEQPELSAIVLSLVDKNGQPQTGFLRANDIYNLKLLADLVVLSACQTGLGKEIRGEGIVGLTRGFMYAGVPRVIVSLWSVNDRATEELMAAFYQKLLKEKLTPAAALRQAQMAMMKDKQWSAPYYWAAFVQQGEWKSHLSSGKRSVVMSKAVSRMKSFCGPLAWAFAFAVLGSIAFTATAQETGTRGVTPEEFVKARPAGAKPTAHPGYKLVSAPIKVGNGDLRQMGITVWRLRASASQDGGPRILVQEGAESISWTPQRVAAGSLLREGDRVRISIESPSTGYLYVIDREQYSSGKQGEPYLIFPTTRIHNGDNQVTAGKLIEIPAQEDRPNYFTLRKSNPIQTGEVLTVIVSDKPLEGLTIGAEAQLLSAKQVDGWEEKWKGQTQRFEMVGGAGRAWTKAEQEAGLDGTRRLTQDDPGPQTVYRVAVPAGQPFFAQIALGYSAPKITRAK